MRTTVAQADQRIWMTHHLVHGVERAVGVVAQRTIEDRLTAVFEQQVVGHFGGLPSLLRGHCCDARLGRWLVIRWIAEREDSLPLRDAAGERLVLDRLRNKPRAEFWLNQALHPVGERQGLDLPPAGAADERILRDFETEHDAGRPRQYLPHHRQTSFLCLCDARHQTPPLLRLVITLQYGD